MSSNTGQAKVCKIFLSYAHEDEGLKEKFCKHLSPLERLGTIQYWDAQQLKAGEKREEILRNFNEANIILCLISPGFVSSNYCYEEEMKRAWHRREVEGVRVIPILLKSVAWETLPFSVVQVLPKDHKAIADRSNKDKAFKIVVQEIEVVVKKELERGR